MRKITCALLALLIVAALLPISAAAACDHSFYQAEAYNRGRILYPALLRVRI